MPDTHITISMKDLLDEHEKLDAARHSTAMATLGAQNERTERMHGENLRAMKDLKDTTEKSGIAISRVDKILCDDPLADGDDGQGRIGLLTRVRTIENGVKWATRIAGAAAVLAVPGLGKLLWDGIKVAMTGGPHP